MKTDLGGPLLRSVSRSFYLSIHFLPPKLRDPIGLAYLLARATDTVADTAELDASARMRRLRTLSDSIQGIGSRDAILQLTAAFAPLQKDNDERKLIEQLPRCLDWLEAMTAEDGADIRNVLAKITAGQMLDAERFGTAGGVIALETAAELDEYTYLVAGCVGEFWTTICHRHLPRFAKSPADQMEQLGAQYGKGLQLINILRDVGADLRGGRCYLPADELQSSGIEPADLLEQPAGVASILARWHQAAEEGIAAGIEYACAIRNWRVRFASALPALIGARTLALLKEAGPMAVSRRVKVRRADVRWILVACLTSVASPGTIRGLFARLSR